MTLLVSRPSPWAAVALLLAACTAERKSVGLGADGGWGDAPDADAPDAAKCVPGGTTALVPAIVACAQFAPARLVIDGQYLYWTAQGSDAIVVKAPLFGGAPEILVHSANAAVGLAIDARFVYYTQPSLGRLMRVPIAGGTATSVATRLDMPTFLAFAPGPDGGSLYWTGGQMMTGVLTRLSLAPGSRPQTLVDGQSQPRALAVRGGFIYWTDFADGTLLRAPARLGDDVDAGTLTPTRLAAGLKSPSDLALEGDFAYVADQAGRIVRVPLDGGALETVADGCGTPFGLATDGLAVYWSTLGDGGIFKAPLVPGGAAAPTCARRAVATGEPDPHFLALSRTAVYWGAWGAGGAIRWTAK